MNFNVTEFYVIFTYDQLSQTVHDRSPPEPCLPDLANTSCAICAVKFGDDDLDEIKIISQRLAVTPCYHIFHEDCMKKYITNIFRFYVARAYAGFIDTGPYTAPLPIPPPIGVFGLFDTSTDGQAGFRPPGNDIYNPFGRAPNIVLNMYKTNPQLICPECRHYLDEEMPPNSESSSCFRAYFQLNGIEYPKLVRRYTFKDESNFDIYGPMYTLERHVAHFEPHIRDRTNTYSYYDMPGHENVNNYFELPQIQAYYAIHQHDGDRSRLKVTEFYRIFPYAIIRAAMAEARHCFDIEGIPVDNQETCTICQQPLDDDDHDPTMIAVARCFHLFHKDCIDDYINTKFRNYISLNQIRTKGSTPLPHQPIGMVPLGERRRGNYDLFDCPNCKKLFCGPDVDGPKGRCFKDYLRRMRIPFPNLLGRITLYGRDIYTDYIHVVSQVDPAYVEDLMPYFNIPAIINGREVLNNRFGVHIDENGTLRNNALDDVDFFGNPSYPPVIYLDTVDVNYVQDEANKPYYQQYPERNKYMDIVYQEYLRYQPFYGKKCRRTKVKGKMMGRDLKGRFCKSKKTKTKRGSARK